MKKLNWQKLPSRVVTAHQSMWTSVSSDSLEPDYCSIEQLFSLPPTETKTRTKTKTEPKEISFIDAKKNLNLNIFLKQFKCSHEDFVSLIQRGDRSKFDVEVLKQLIKLLPEKHEVENLKSHHGDRDKLASVDQFYLLLLDVPSYSLRIQCMLLCEESSSLLETLRPKAELLERACYSVRESSRLPSFCKLILSVGNFLNYGSHTGNAEGFKISTLLKLTETKANKSRITLLHHILEEAEENHPDLLNLPHDLEICEKAAGLSLESIQSETSSLVKQLKNCERKVSCSSEDVKQQYLSVLQDNLQVCEQLQQRLSSLEDKRADLSIYLCEDSGSFSLDELFSTIKTFRGLFLRAVKENESRRQQEKRKKKLEEDKKLNGDSSKKIIRKDMSVQNDGCIIDNLLAEIRRGYNLKRTQPDRSEVRRSPVVDQPDLQISGTRPEPRVETQRSSGPSTPNPEGDQDQTKVQDPEGHKTKNQDPEGDKTKDQDPEGDQTKDEEPKEDQNQTKVQDPEGDQTKDQNPEGGSETSRMSPGPAGSRDLTEDSEFEEIPTLETRTIQQDKVDPESGPDQPSKTSATGSAGGGDTNGVRRSKTKKGCVSH